MEVSDTTQRVIGYVVGAISFAILVILSVLWHNTYIARPSPFTQRDYTATSRAGNNLDAYLQSKGKTASTTKMRDLTVATATLGGIELENTGWPNPYVGTVSTDAVNLQVRAGARAIVFDIWPDPADPTIPVVCAMQDDSAVGGVPGWWLAHGGLSRGTGRYSNWKLLTRNTVRAGTMMKTAVDTAFTTQATDPFFLILILHGAMTVDYLNTLGNDLQNALSTGTDGTTGRGLPPTARPGLLYNTLCNATADLFQGKVCVIVCPDIQPGFQSLPNVNTYQQFAAVYATTTMMNNTNILQMQPNTVLYGPENISALTQDTAQPCDPSGAPGSTVPPPQGGFCVIQPSTGTGITSTNKMYPNPDSFLGALRTGAQFVGANLFDTTPGFLDNTYFTPDRFGTYSFMLTR